MHKVNTKILICTMLIVAIIIGTAIVQKANAWGADVHVGEAGDAGIYKQDEYSDLTDNRINILKDNSQVPDYCDQGWDSILWPLTNAPKWPDNEIYHSVRHSYLVDIAASDDPWSDIYKNGFITLVLRNGSIITEWDHAAVNVSVNANKAKYYLDESSPNYNPDEGYKYLGYSMHYMSDSTMPYHATIHGLDRSENPYDKYDSGNLFKQIWPTSHNAYEAYVGYNWFEYYTDPVRQKPSKEFINCIYEPGPDEEYYISDPETAAEVGASIAYLNSEYITDEMNKNPDGWEDDEGVIYSTRWCLEEGTKLNMGLIDYAKRND